MINNNLSLDIGSDIKLNGVRFTVDGYIVFEDSDGTSWTEYKIKSKEEFQILWLSADKLNDEYAIYSEELYSEEFLEENIKVNGYNIVEDKSARVLDYRGNVDVDLGEQVFYKEYENNREESLISIEDWNGDHEFSKGYYVSKDDIEKLDFNNRKDTFILDKINNLDKLKEDKVYLVILVAFILAITVIAMVYKSNNPDKRLSRIISLSTNSSYETSITSDLDKDIKANVYSTDYTIEEVTKLIIDEMQGDIEDVQENEEDGAVAIITKDEMALIYRGEDSKTLIQVSLRDYVYSSRNTLYMGSNISNHYYRGYYYSRGYTEDQKRYRNLTNSYADYNGSTFTPNYNNKYKTYSSSIRQSSINSRSSSGDGISSGK